MTRRDFWIGLAALIGALLLHAALPRYEYRPLHGNVRVWMRVDRWTGQARFVAIDALGVHPLP